MQYQPSHEAMQWTEECGGIMKSLMENLLYSLTDASHHSSFEQHCSSVSYILFFIAFLLLFPFLLNNDTMGLNRQIYLIK